MIYGGMAWWCRRKRLILPSTTYLSSSLSFWQLPRKFPNWHEWMCSWIWRRNASLNSKACGNCSVRCHTHSKNWVNTGETSFGSPSKWPHLNPQKAQALKIVSARSSLLRHCKLKPTNYTYRYYIYNTDNKSPFVTIILVDICNPSPQEGEAGRPEIQGQPCYKTKHQRLWELTKALREKNNRDIMSRFI